MLCIHPKHMASNKKNDWSYFHKDCTSKINYGKSIVLSVLRHELCIMTSFFVTILKNPLKTLFCNTFQKCVASPLLSLSVERATNIY